MAIASAEPEFGEELVKNTPQAPHGPALGF